MKVLISAFACNPYKGSEPGVGWNWAKYLSEYNTVIIVTRKENKDDINRYIKENNINIKVYYHDIPLILRWIKKVPMGLYLYYLLWQFTLVKFIKEIDLKEEIDIVHHVTYASLKFSTRLYKTNIPYILGPIGGGECTPKTLYSTFSTKYKLNEFIRNMHLKLTFLNLNLRKSFENASKILVTSRDSYKYIPSKFNQKVDIMQTIGIDQERDIKSRAILNKNDKFIILFVGRLLEWKGINIIPEIINKLEESIENLEVIIIGDGPDKDKLLKKVKDLDLESKFKIIKEIPRDDVISYYSIADVFLFPSYHDSGGMVILEAMVNKLPVICLDCGGPGVNVDDNTGIKINPNQKFEKIIDDFVESIKYIYDDKNFEEVKRLKDLAYNKVMLEYDWRNKAKKMNDIYHQIKKIN